MGDFPHPCKYLVDNHFCGLNSFLFVHQKVSIIVKLNENAAPKKIITILGCKCTLKNENMLWMYQVDVYEFPVFYLLRNKVKRALFHVFCAKNIYIVILDG